MRKDYLYWIWLSLRFGPNASGFAEVLDAFGDPYSVYVADRALIAERLGPSSPVVPRLSDKDMTEAHRIYDYCVSRGVSILTYGDLAYPARLKTIQNPPILLYYIGTLPAWNRRLCLGVVGTRRMSEYGKRMAYTISYELAAAGTVVVSGMALGCDAVAAGGAINAGGTTVAVLGSGIDVVYPRQHLKLMEIIAQNGAVMTEYPPGTPPMGAHFPVRNRIISGLCQGTLAIEGNLHSGAMLTVGHAVKQGRQVFAVPGNVGESGAEGTNELIRNGATVVLDAGDILEFFEVSAKEMIHLDAYHAARLRSEPDEEALLRMGISARISERTPVGAEREIPMGEMEGMTRKRKKSPARILEKERKAEEAPAKGNVPAKKATAPAATRAEKPHTPKEASASQSRAGDHSEEILASLSDRDRKIFCEMPLDRAISIDQLTAAGFSIADIMTAMTILEIRGLVTSLPGGLYIKK